MAEVPIAVIWDSRKRRLSVHPEFVTLVDKEEDEAAWVLLSDDPNIEMHASESVVFVDDPPKGPFRQLGRHLTDKKKSKGTELMKEEYAKNYKYTIKLSNGETLDPGLRRQPRP